MMRIIRNLALLALLAAAALPALAQNPEDVKRAQQEAHRIHDTSIREIALAIDKPIAYVLSFLPGGTNAGKKLSEETDLSAKQYRAVRRMIAQRNYAIREAYMNLGLVIPRNTDVSFL